MAPFTVAALYKFTALHDCEELQVSLLALCKSHNIKGTLLLAWEGINGTVAGSRDAIDALKAWFEGDARFHDLEYKESTASLQPFYRMKVRLKKEIVTLGVETVDPTITVGTYVEPKDWNALMADPDVILIDTRNDYECDVGTFEGALNPKTKTFKEFPAYVQANLDPAKHKKVAMVCTGGIRCEKASSYMLDQGFEEVYHLKGGILKYLEEVPAEESLWRGECFVFDHRTSLTHGLAEGAYDTCYGCRSPVSPQDKELPQFKMGVHCPHCYETLSQARMQRAAHRHAQVLRAREQGTQHLGD